MWSGGQQMENVKGEEEEEEEEGKKAAEEAAEGKQKEIKKGRGLLLPSSSLPHRECPR